MQKIPVVGLEILYLSNMKDSMLRFTDRATELLNKRVNSKPELIDGVFKPYSKEVMDEFDYAFGELIVDFKLSVSFFFQRDLNILKDFYGLQEAKTLRGYINEASEIGSNIFEDLEERRKKLKELGDKALYWIKKNSNAYGLINAFIELYQVRDNTVKNENFFFSVQEKFGKEFLKLCKELDLSALNQKKKENV